MDVRRASANYEGWLRGRTRVVEDDVVLKHAKMSGGDPFPFLRATYYRWCELFPSACPQLAAAPAVPSAGDAHAENFGTWRDAEGRPVWGVNDLDEADVLPYPNDLVRLATSLRLAARRAGGRPSPRALAAAVLDGYRGSLGTGGTATVLSDDDRALGHILAARAADPGKFWAGLERHRDGSKAVKPPREARGLAVAAVPAGVKLEFFPRQGVGLGSLGRPRFAAVGRWAGGRLVREVKARVPPATRWLRDRDGDDGDRDRSASNGTAGIPDVDVAASILASPRRAPDPSLRLAEGWVVRRLAPDAAKIELKDLEDVDDWGRLAAAMGHELASLHLSAAGTAGPAVRRHLAKLGDDWLHEAAKVMAARTEQDWADWRHG